MTLLGKMITASILLSCLTATDCRQLDSSSGRPYAVRESSLSQESRAAMDKLLADNPGAASLAQSAKGILVFTNVVKGGFVVGGFHGEGALFKRGTLSGYYDTLGASYGLQAGIQSYAYALFFMTDEALQRLDLTEGFEVGVGPTVVIADAGIAKNITTRTTPADVYAFIFDQRGLMAGMGLQGSKIYRIDR